MRYKLAMYLLVSPVPTTANPFARLTGARVAVGAEGMAAAPLSGDAAVAEETILAKFGAASPQAEAPVPSLLYWLVPP